MPLLLAGVNIRHGLLPPPWLPLILQEFGCEALVDISLTLSPSILAAHCRQLYHGLFDGSGACDARLDLLPRELGRRNCKRRSDNVPRRRLDSLNVAVETDC